MKKGFFSGAVLLALLLWTGVSRQAIAQSSATGSIGGFFWKDANNNGRQDPGEKGVSGVKILLWRSSKQGSNSDSLINSAFTNSDGRYKFSNLSKADYFMQVVPYFLPDTCQLSLLKNQPGVPANLDSDFRQAGGYSDLITIDPAKSGLGKDNNTIDAALIYRSPPAWGSFEGAVWHDLNDNGIRDAGEPGLKGVVVKLASITVFNGVITTDTTDENGKYDFPRLRTGTYDVILDENSFPDSLKISNKRNVRFGGGNETNDSDFGTSLFGPLVEIDAEGAGDERYKKNIDAALVGRLVQNPPQQSSTGSISGIVWKDANNNGRRDDGEVGRENNALCV